MILEAGRRSFANRWPAWERILYLQIPVMFIVMLLWPMNHRRLAAHMPTSRLVAPMWAMQQVGRNSQGRRQLLERTSLGQMQVLPWQLPHVMTEVFWIGATNHSASHHHSQSHQRHHHRHLHPRDPNSPLPLLDGLQGASSGREVSVKREFLVRFSTRGSLSRT